MQTQKTTTAVKSKNEVDQTHKIDSAVDDLHDIASVEVALSDSGRNENHNNEQEEIIKKPSFEVNEDDPGEQHRLRIHSTSEQPMAASTVISPTTMSTRTLTPWWNWTQKTRTMTMVCHRKYFLYVLYDYDGVGEEELSFKTGDIIKVLENDESGWAAGEIEVRPKDAATDDSELYSTRRGLFPMNYVRVTM